MGKLDLSKFKKVRSGEKHTVLRHPEGHEITIFHKALSKPIKQQLDKLEMAEGGLVAKKPVVNAIRTSVGGSPLPEANQPAPQYTPDEEAKRKATRESYGYAEGGQVPPKPVQTAQDSMRKAFHFAKGGPILEKIEGDTQEVPASQLESNYAGEESAAAGDTPKSTGEDWAAQIGNDIPNVDPNESKATAPITPPTQDNSHSHLSEAIKNLSQKFASAPTMQDKPASDSVAMGQQPAQPQAPQDAPMGNPKGTLPQQAIANVNQANQAEMAAAKNTQQSLNQEAQIHGDEAQKMQDLHAKYEQIGNNLHQKFEDTAAEVEKGRIDPSHWWNSRSTGSQILTAIGMLFSGAMTGASGHPEMASKAIDEAIDRDIDSQKANLQNKNSLLGKYMEMYNNLPQAEAAARLTLSAGVEGLVKQQAAKLGSANAINTALQANAQRRQALLPQMEGLAKGQVMGQMYNEMAGGAKSQPSDAEQAYQKHMSDMRILNPDLGKDMENKYLPNVGVARVPVPDKLREDLTMRKDLSDKMAQLELFAKKHQGTVMDRAIVNQGKAMASQVQDAFRTAHQQGVFKESEKNFIEGILHTDPTSFFAEIRTLPGYRQARQFNDQTVNQYYKSYGIKPFSGSNGPESGEQPAKASTSQTATMGGKQYRKVPGGWEPVK